MLLYKIIEKDDDDLLYHLYNNGQPLTKKIGFDIIENNSIKCFKIFIKFGEEITLDEYNSHKKISNTDKQISMWFMLKTHIEKNRQPVDEYDKWEKKLPLSKKLNIINRKYNNKLFKKFSYSDDKTMSLQFTFNRLITIKWIHYRSYCSGMKSKYIITDSSETIIITKPDNWKLTFPKNITLKKLKENVELPILKISYENFIMRR